MAVDERSRHELYEQARSTWIHRAADTLMELLPPVGWADVATKRDLDTLETRLETRLESAIDRATVRLIMWLVPLNAGLAFGVARLAA